MRFLRIVIIESNIFYQQLWFLFSRFWFISQICRVCTPGLRPVGFAEFWLADQACSLVILFVDCEFLLCWYLVDGTIYGPRKGVIPHCGDYSSIRAACSILPAVIRFIQCVRRFQDSGDAFPHLVNAGKYSTTLLKGLFLTSPFRVNFKSRSSRKLKNTTLFD